jgi:hypothetical protein
MAALQTNPVGMDAIFGYYGGSNCRNNDITLLSQFLLLCPPVGAACHPGHCSGQ